MDVSEATVIAADYIRNEALTGATGFYFDMIEKLVPDQLDWKKRIRANNGARDILTPEGIEYAYSGFVADRQFFRFIKVDYRPIEYTPTEAKPLRVPVSDDEVAGLMALAATLDPVVLEMSGLGSFVHKFKGQVEKRHLGRQVATIYQQIA